MLLGKNKVIFDFYLVIFLKFFIRIIFYLFILNIEKENVFFNLNKS